MAAEAGLRVVRVVLGHDLVGGVDVTFLRGQAPAGSLEGPSIELAADKSAFGSDRVHRWFDRSWTPVQR